MGVKFLYGLYRKNHGGVLGDDMLVSFPLFCFGCTNGFNSSVFLDSFYMCSYLAPLHSPFAA